MLEFHFQLLMQFGSVPALEEGGGTMHGINLLNDTGSNILTLFYADLQYLANYPLYLGWQGYIAVGVASGNSEVWLSLLVEIRFVRPLTLFPVGGIGSKKRRWSVSLFLAFTAYLSGSRMRILFFFGTRPGNHQVAVSVVNYVVGR